MQTAQNLKAELQELQKPLKQEEPKEDKPIIQNNDNDPKPSPFSSDYKQWKERHPEYTSPRITRRDGEKSIFSDMVWSAEEQTWIKPKPEEKVIEEPPLSNTEEPRRPLLKRRK
ncbi:hypothetical protein PITCH_A80001 [uncultured Desulfobacterium sp.]|uniref:Uncharacterized protein n=1 Tax=uncultured Desulfobacterium sp. TaxID=201089 RepID=A0A445N2V7_9BACT|nr:hypothetical protein PITCH_A1540006 [uncultured Desulfobacterium sp.]SPD76006.1 hypothetical protein PITCH_A80001 [uncultured Desulfobacterium sp.]